MALKHIVYAECRVHRKPFYLVVDSETGMVEDAVGYQRAFELLNQPAGRRVDGDSAALPGAGGRGALPGAERAGYTGEYTYTRGRYAIEPYGGRGGPPAERDEYDAPGADEVTIRGILNYTCPYCGSEALGEHDCGIIHCDPGPGKNCVCPGCGEPHTHTPGGVIHTAGSSFEGAPRGLGSPPGGGGRGLPHGSRGDPDTPALPY